MKIELQGRATAWSSRSSSGTPPTRSAGGPAPRELGRRAGHGDRCTATAGSASTTQRRDVVTIWRDADRLPGPPRARASFGGDPATDLRERTRQGRRARRRRRHPSTAARSGGSSATERSGRAQPAVRVLRGPATLRAVGGRLTLRRHRRQVPPAARRSRSPSTSGCPSTSACSSSRRRPTRSTSGVSCGARPRPARSAARAAPARAPGRARSPRASRGPARPRATRSRP